MKVEKFEKVVLAEIQNLQKHEQVRPEDIQVSYNQIHGLASLYSQPLHPAMFVPFGAGGRFRP